MNIVNNLLHPIVKWIACGLLMLGLVLPFLPNQAAADGIFSDVSPSNSHYLGILDAYENGFVGGYPDGTFKPNLKLSRSNVVKSLGKFVLVSTGTSLEDYDFSNTAPFNDVPPTYSDQELYRYSLLVKKAGIFSGSNNNLLPKNYMTRQQMAKVLVNAFNLSHVEGKQSIVKDNHLANPEFREYIDILSENGVTTVTNFRPGETTTRGQFATFLSNANRASIENTPVEPPEKEIPKQPDEEPKPGEPKPGEPKPGEPKPEVPQEPEEDDDEWVEPARPEKPKEEPKEPAKPVSIEELLPIKKYLPGPHKFPETIKVTYSDASEVDHNVVWNTDGINMEVEGKHTLTGKVQGTELSAKLEVTFGYITIMPLRPTLIIIPYNPDPIVVKASDLIAKLPDAVKNADNAFDAAAKWGVANQAVTDVIKEFPQYNTTSWENTLTAQLKVIEKRQVDINNTKATATVAVNALLGKVKARYTSASKAQLDVNDTSSKLNAYKQLDKKADTAALTRIVNEAQIIVNDMKILEKVAEQTTIQILEPRSSYPIVFPKSPTIVDQGVRISWGRGIGFLPVTRESGGYWSIERPFFKDDPAFQTAGFVANITKGNVTYVKHFSVYVPETKLFTQNGKAVFVVDYWYEFN